MACLWDPAAVAACVKAGVGSRITLDVGGKVDARHGAPLTVTGVVRTLSDGRFVHKGPMMRGLPGPPRPDGGARRGRREGDPDHPPLADARPGDDPVRRHRPPRGEDPRHQVHHPLPRGVRADREGDHRGRRAGALLIEPRARFAFKRVRRPIFPLDPEATYP